MLAGLCQLLPADSKGPDSENNMFCTLRALHCPCLGLSFCLSTCARPLAYTVQRVRKLKKKQVRAQEREEKATKRAVEQLHADEPRDDGGLSVCSMCVCARAFYAFACC